VVLDLHNNQLSGSLNDFAFTTVANRQDLHSTLRYFDIGNNSFSGEILTRCLHTANGDGWQLMLSLWLREGNSSQPSSESPEFHVVCVHWLGTKTFP